MVFNLIIAKIKLLFILIVSIFRKALCCFSRRRKLSNSDSEILQFVNVVRENRTGNQKNENERDWNSWDDSPRTVEEHIEQYRQQLAQPSTPKDLEPEPDFFNDMTPKIKPQQKFYLGTKTEQKTDFSRLQATSDIPIATNADLEDWDDENTGDWDEQDPETTKQLIRETRKELRNKRQSSTKQKSNISPQKQMIAEKILSS